jgi:hypothetical protein
MTTQRHSAGIEVSDNDWVRGGSEKTSYISPWYVTTIKYRDLDRQQGKVAQSIVTVAIDDLYVYIPPPDDQATNSD